MSVGCYCDHLDNHTIFHPYTFQYIVVIFEINVFLRQNILTSSVVSYEIPHKYEVFAQGCWHGAVPTEAMVITFFKNLQVVQNI